MKTLIYKLHFALKAKFLKNEPFINGYISSKEYNAIWKYITSLLNLKKRDKLLEFGCGTGLQLGVISKLCNKVVALDHSGSMVAKARKNNEGNSDVNILHHQTLSLPFKDGAFDKVLSWSIFQYLEHRASAENLLREFYRVVKPGGLILIGDIPRVPEKNLHLKLKKRSPFSFVTNFLNCFLYLYFDPPALKEFCESNFGEARIVFDSIIQQQGRFNLLINAKK